ncbi:MAG TPA: TIGR02281 family clan AA aspartic protease [Stellaceae bacterium]|nr:TIGR02281 family clan AA aspartic protease [Stellaceae bacterium]
MTGDPEDSAADRRRRPPASGRALRYALVMLFGWIVLGVVMVAVMRVMLGPVPPPSKAAALPRPGAAAAPASAVKAPSNTLVFAADAKGHVVVDASVNGAPVRFLVDTGASMVALTPADARAAGVTAGSGDTLTISTAHGAATAARASLRSLRLGQLELEDVPAVVMDESLPVSLLGMSFLSRLEGYQMRNGILTIDW